MPKVSDPSIINQLDEFDANATILDLYGETSGKVSDPNLLSQLEQPQGQPALQAAFEEQKGLGTRLADNRANRIAQIGSLADQAVAGTISQPEALVRSGLKYAQLLPDAAGSVIAEATPDFIKEPLSNAVTAIANTAPAQYAAGKISDFNQNYPVASGRIGSVLDAANLLAPFAQVGGKNAINAVAETTGAGAKVIGKEVIVPAAKLADRAINVKTVIPSADEVKATSSALYQKADSVGGVLKPEITNEFVDSVSAIRPQTEIGKAVKGDSPVTQLVERLQAVKGKPMSLQAAQEVDEFLGDLIDGQFTNGKISKEGLKLQDIQRSLRDKIENASDDMVVGGKEGFEALKEGRQLWSASRKMADVERIITNADSYAVPATAIKTGFRQLEKRGLRGYDEEAKAAIKKAARTGIAGEVLSLYGSRLGPLISGGAGFATGGTLGAAGASALSLVTSSAARNAATALQVGRANAVTKAIAKSAGVTRTEPRIDFSLLQEEFLKRKGPLKVRITPKDKD